jgi:hypothetical protein
MEEEEEKKDGEEEGRKNKPADLVTQNQCIHQ